MPAPVRSLTLALAALIVTTGCSTSTSTQYEPHWRLAKLVSADEEVGLLVTKTMGATKALARPAKAGHRPEAEASDIEPRVILAIPGTPPNEDDLEPFCSLFPGAVIYVPVLESPPSSFEDYSKTIERALDAIRSQGVTKVGIIGYSDGGRALLELLEADPDLRMDVEFILLFGAKVAPRAASEFAPGEGSLRFWRWLPSAMLRAFIGEEDLRAGVRFADPTLTDAQVEGQVSELVEVYSRTDVPRASAQMTADELNRDTAFLIPVRFRSKTRLILAEKDGLATPTTQKAPAEKAGITVRVLQGHGHFFLDLDADDAKSIKEDLTDW